MKKVILVIGFLVCTVSAIAQTSSSAESVESLKRSIMQVEDELYEVKLNLHQSQKQLKNGILVATIGYSVTILGGQLLGTNPELGRGLLYAGGAIGIAGTVVLVKGFNKISLGPPSRPRSDF